MNGAISNILRIISLILTRYKIYKIEAMNIFNYIDNYLKNNTSVYGNLLNNKFNIENELSSTDKNLYKQIKYDDETRFKVQENKNLMIGTIVQRHPESVSGIGNVIQIC